MVNPGDVTRHDDSKILWELEKGQRLEEMLM